MICISEVILTIILLVLIVCGILLYLYYRRRSNRKTLGINHIIDNVYISDWYNSYDKNELKKNNIKRIINLNTSEKSEIVKYLYNSMGIEELFIYINDKPNENISKEFQKTMKFIKETDANVLVHCTAGVSRSGTIVLNYLMTEHSMRIDEALEFAREKRKIINPNTGFIKQLKNYHS